MIVITLVEILKSIPAKEDGSVNQRFLIAILQKISIKTEAVPILFDLKMIDWSVDFITRAVSKPVKSEALMSPGIIFALDFDSALLANVLHAKSTSNTLAATREFTTGLIMRLLSLITRKNLPTSVLMHLLICLSYLNKDQFAEMAESKQVNFSERIAQFVEEYSKKPVHDNENDEIDKRTVMDLCAHMFHSKEMSENDLSATLDYNDMKPDDKIREFENEQGDLIFECFQDEQDMI